MTFDERKRAAGRQAKAKRKRAARRRERAGLAGGSGRGIRAATATTVGGVRRTDATGPGWRQQSAVVWLWSPGARPAGIGFGAVIVLLGPCIIYFSDGGLAHYLWAIVFLLIGLWVVVGASYLRVRLDERGVTECYWWLPKRVRWHEVASVYVSMVSTKASAPILQLHNGTELKLRSLGQEYAQASRRRSRVEQQAGMIRARLPRNDKRQS